MNIYSSNILLRIIAKNVFLQIINSLMNYIEVLSFMQDPIPLAMTCGKAFEGYKQLMRRHKFGMLVDYLNGDILKYDTAITREERQLYSMNSIYQKVIDFAINFNRTAQCKFVFAGGYPLCLDNDIDQKSSDLDIFVISEKGKRDCYRQDYTRIHIWT